MQLLLAALEMQLLASAESMRSWINLGPAKVPSYSDTEHLPHDETLQDTKAPVSHAMPAENRSTDRHNSYSIRRQLVTAAIHQRPDPTSEQDLATLKQENHSY